MGIIWNHSQISLSFDVRHHLIDRLCQKRPRHFRIALYRFKLGYTVWFESTLLLDRFQIFILGLLNVLVRNLRQYFESFEQVAFGKSRPCEPLRSFTYLRFESWRLKLSLFPSEISYDIFLSDG